MKKLILTLVIFIFASQIGFGQCTTLYIAGVIDGPLAGGTPKGVQFCANAAIADLSIYGFGSANNGGGSDGQEFTFPAVALNAGDCIWVASEATNFTNWFGLAPEYTAGAAAINGDDAIELFCNSVVSDVFGDISTDGNGETWEYLDGWAFANDDQPNPIFTDTDWSYSGPDALDGESDNATAPTPYPNPPMIDASLCFVDEGNFTNFTVTTNSDGDEWTFNGQEYVGNGFCGGGCAEAVEFWLISSRFDYGNATILNLNFNYDENFGNTDLEVLYSIDYTGAGDPNLATWTNLTTLSDADGSETVDISIIPDLSNFYISYKYADDGADGYSSWEISNIIIDADDCTPVNCLINNAVVDNAMCSGDDFVFDVTFDAANGSGSFNIVDENGAILATVTAADGTDITTTVTVVGPTTSGQSPTSIAVVDATDASCTSAVVALPVSDCPVTLFISEISYNPCTAQGNDNDCEYVIISNAGTMAADISGYAIANAFGYTFPAGTIVPAGGNLSLGRSANCGGFVPFDLAGGWSGNLNNSGETIALLDDNGNTVFSIAYDDGTGADGNCDALIGDANGGTAPGNSLLIPLPIMISDPCSCPNGFFCEGANFAQEVITITTGVVGEAVAYVSGSALSPSMGLFGTDGLPLATDGSLTATDNLDGTYSFIGYVPADNASLYTANFEVTSATANAGMKAFISGGPCPECATAVDVCIERVCQGNALYVLADGSTDPIDATGITFFWYKDGDLTAPVAVVVGNAYFSPTEPGTYTVTGITDNCIEYNLSAVKVPFEVTAVVNCKNCP